MTNGPRLQRTSISAMFLAAALIILAGCTQAAPGPGTSLDADPSDSERPPPRATVDGGAPARINTEDLGGGSGGETGGEYGAGGSGSEGSTAPTVMLPDDPIAAATALALPTVNMPADLQAQLDLMARSGEAATLESKDIHGLAVFLTDASRIDQQVILEVGPLYSELKEDPELLGDAAWLAKAIKPVEAAGRVGRTIERGLDGQDWPKDMVVLVEETIRGRIAVPMTGGAAGFLAAVRTANADAAVTALENVGSGVSGLVLALEQMPTLMLAADRATQTVEALRP